MARIDNASRNKGGFRRRRRREQSAVSGSSRHFPLSSASARPQLPLLLYAMGEDEVGNEEEVDDEADSRMGG